jgi:hypothetical protein
MGEQKIEKWKWKMGKQVGIIPGPYLVSLRGEKPSLVFTAVRRG